MTVSDSTIANYLGVDRQQIVKRRDVGDSVIVLVDKGIGGTPRYTIPLSDLQFKTVDPPAPPTVEETPEETAVSEPVEAAVDLDGKTVAELQDIARDRGVSYSGLRKSELIEALS